MFTIKGKTELNQWEQNVSLTNPNMVVGDAVRFVNGSGKTIIMYAYDNGGVVVDIPNIMLQHNRTIVVDLIDDVKDCSRFNVVAQEKPEGYVFEDNVKPAKGNTGGGVSPEEVTTIVKEQFPGGVGYEETVVVTEPLRVTWDGNTEGLVNVGDIYFKVSDAVLTIEQMEQLYLREIHSSISIGGGEPMDLMDLGLSKNDSLDVFTAEIVILALKSNVTCGNFVFPEPGIYFAKVDENTFASAMTTDFPLEQTKVVTKKLDEKFLPDVVQYEIVENNDFGNITYSCNLAFSDAYAMDVDTLKKSIVFGANDLPIVCKGNSRNMGEFIVLHFVYLSANSDMTISESKRDFIWQAEGITRVG